jgi:adenylate cyclase
MSFSAAPTIQDFYALLDETNTVAPFQQDSHEKMLWARFGVERAVLVLDMAGFSSKVQKHGLLYFLRKIRYMQSVVGPLLTRHAGELVKFEADNAYAVFERAADAIVCAQAIHDAFRTSTDGAPDVDDVTVSIGLSQGRILLIPRHDFFGDAVNLASKLGEDVAGHAETLLSESLIAEAERLPGFRVERLSVGVSGLSLVVGRLLRG